MTWKLYALSSAAVLVTWALSWPVAGPRPSVEEASSQAVSPPTSAVDLGAEADRLHARLSATGDYDGPARNAFRFGEVPKQPIVSVPPAVPVETPAVSEPVRPRITLTGMATSLVDGVAVRTAIFSSVRGVQLAQQGDTLDEGYRVVSVGENEVTLQAPDQGPTTTLRLATP